MEKVWERRPHAFPSHYISEFYLSGLCMMSVHPDKISKDKQLFIDRFGRDPRRFLLLFLSDADKSC